MQIKVFIYTNMLHKLFSFTFLIIYFKIHHNISSNLLLCAQLFFMRFNIKQRQFIHLHCCIPSIWHVYKYYICIYEIYVCINHYLCLQVDSKTFCFVIANNAARNILIHVSKYRILGVEILDHRVCAASTLTNKQLFCNIIVTICTAVIRVQCFPLYLTVMP